MINTDNCQQNEGACTYWLVQKFVYNIFILHNTQIIIQGPVYFNQTQTIYTPVVCKSIIFCNATHTYRHILQDSKE